MVLELKLVDGFKIRNYDDVDFSGEGSDVMYTHIPKGEMWLDEVLQDEQDFFFQLHEFERSLLENGIAYAEARKRVCSAFVANCKDKPNVVIKDYSTQSTNNVRVLIVDGALVRKYYDPKFIQGGHDLVYNYIPKNTIWMETAFHKEYHFTFTHEMYERECMARPYKWNYPTAHECALNVERIERNKFFPQIKV